MANLDYDPKRNDPRFIEPQDQPKTPDLERQPGQPPAPVAAPTPTPAPQTAPVANAPLPGASIPPPVNPPRPPPKPPPPPASPKPPPKPPQAYDPPPVRKMERWGDDYWAMQELQNNPNLVNSRFLPTEREAPGVLGGANRQLAAFSAPAIAQPANIIAGLASIVGPFFDLMSNNAFSQHYRMARLGGREDEMLQLKKQEMQLKMHEDQMKERRERMIDMAEDLQMTHSQMLSDYKSVFDDLKSGAITEDEAKQQITDLDQTWHHQNLDNVMKDQGLQGVANALDLEHNKFVHSWAATASLRSADKTRKEQEKEQAAAQKQADLEAPFRKGAGAAPPSGTAQSVIDYTAPGQPAGTASTTAPGAEAAEEDEQGLNQSPALNAAAAAGLDDREAIDNVAQDMLNGNFKKSDYKGNERVLGYATQRYNELRKKIEGIRSDPNLNTPEQVYDALNKVSPQLKDQVEGLVTGETAPPSRVNASKQPWPLVYAMAKKAEPRLDTILQTRPGTLKSFTSGLDGKQVAQLGTAYDHGRALIQDIKDLPAGYLQIMDKLANNPAKMAIFSRIAPEAAAKIARVEKDVQVFASETGAVLAYGQGTGHEREQLQAGLDWTSPARTIAAAQTQMDRLRDREENLAHKFKMGTGRDFNEFKRSFGIDEKIMSDNPNAEAGWDEMEKDRAGDNKVIDYRNFDAGAQ